MKNFILICAFFFLSVELNAQFKPYVKGEFSWGWDKMFIHQLSEDLELSSLGTPSTGFFIGHSIHDNFSLELGLMHKVYGSQLTYIGEGYHRDIFLPIPDKIYQVNLRLVPKVSLYKQKLFLIGIVGFSGYYEKAEMNYGYSSNFVALGTNDTLFFSYHPEKVKGFKPLLETGLGLTFDFISGFSLGLSTHYYTGFKTIKRWEYSHQFNSVGLLQTKEFINKGNYISFTFSAYYRFGKK